MRNKSYFVYAIIFCVGFILCYAISYFYPNFYIRNTLNFYPLRESTLNQNKYQFIDPLLAMGRPDNFTSQQYISLKNSINSFLDSEIENNDLKIASIFFRDETTGRGFTINPTEEYTLASLIKVPIMISYFKLAEKDPSILSKNITYTGKTDYNLERNISSNDELKKGQTYTVEELIEYMIKHSDNNAYSLLANNLNITNTYEYTNNLFSDLGIDGVSFDKDYINITAYSLFFRVLYNATYLSRDMSENALRLLSETDFKDGLSAGVTKDVTIAQKFGESVIKANSGEVIGRELHNCGIIYYPDHPYVLCIMTKGNNLTKLENIISTISKTTFDYTEKISE